MTAEQHYLQTALNLAQHASQVVMELFKGSLSKNRKKDRSWVTEADLRSDEILREGLISAFPNHAVLTEESGLFGNKNSEWVWLVDPLDGTKAYAQGIPGFSVMVGLLKRKIPYLGVVVDPLEGLVYEAVCGQGAFLRYMGKNKKNRLRVSKRNDFKKMPLALSPGIPKNLLAKLRKRFQPPFIESINSVGIKTGLVVQKKADIYMSHHPVHYWDTCAPQVILEEAGGKFTNSDGSNLIYNLDNKDYSQKTLILVTSGTRHDELVRIIGREFEKK